MRLGVAGYMGAGKSLSAKFLAERYSWQIIDGDAEARTLMLESRTVISQVGDLFGVVVDGKIDFSLLGAKVFADSTLLQQLNDIVHPPLLEHLRKKIAESSKTTILDAALLPVWPLEGLVDKALWVDAPRDDRVVRLERRMGLSKEVLEQRCRLQEKMIPVPDKRCWSTLENLGSIPTLYALLEEWGGRLDE